MRSEECRERGRWLEGGVGRWAYVRLFHITPSDCLKSLKTLSAVAAHLCCLFLVAGWKRRGACCLFLGVRFLTPFRNPLLFVCTHLTVWRASASAMACGRLLYNCRPVFKLSLLPLFHPLPLPLSSPVRASPEWTDFLSSPNLSALLTIALWELYLLQLPMDVLWNLTLSFPITRLSSAQHII